MWSPPCAHSVLCVFVLFHTGWLCSQSLALYEVYKQLQKRGLVDKVIDEVYAIGRQCNWAVPVPPELRRLLSFPTKDDPLVLPFAFP